MARKKSTTKKKITAKRKTNKWLGGFMTIRRVGKKRNTRYSKKLRKGVYVYILKDRK